MTEKYDVVIIGSGLGGLVSGVILAKEGKKVCILEKNNQYGGNLQTFVRDKHIFDTGVHYIGALSEGQNLYRFFRYLGIMDELRLLKMDEDHFDKIIFGDEENEYPHAQGEENFIHQLCHFFPDQEKYLRRYVQVLQQTCDSFPLYNLKNEGKYDQEILQVNARRRIEELIPDPVLQAVLAGSNFLYAGIGDKTPFYIHALVTSSYMQSAWRCLNGGSQITKLLVKELRKHGGEIYKRKEVVEFCFDGGQMDAVRTKDGSAYKAGMFISNIELKTTLQLAGKEKFRKPFYNRIQSLEPTISAFSIYIVFKPESFPYFNHNFYYFSEKKKVWDAVDYDPGKWPESYMLSMNVSSPGQQWAESLTAISYMKYDEVKNWEETINTVVEEGERGASYEEFKRDKTELFISRLEERFPDIRSCIQSVYTSTPLSYRDYIGGQHGNIYGYVKDAADPLRTSIGTKTKIDNLYLTGQGINMHGIVGVTIGAVLTCCQITGKDYLITKIDEETR